MPRTILIGYGTRYGSTAEVATEMAKTMEDAGVSVEVVDLKKSQPSRPVNEYDLVVIGSGIQAGQWTKETQRFLRENQRNLENTEVALFVVCGYAASPEKCGDAQIQYLDRVAAYYPSLHIIKTGLFGGVFDFKKYNIAIRALIKRMLRQESGEEPPEEIDFRDWNKIRDWARSLVTS